MKQFIHWSLIATNYFAGGVLVEIDLQSVKMDSFGFVILTGLCTAILHIYLSVNVGRARRKYGVPVSFN